MSLTYDQIMNELADYRVLDQLLCCSGYHCGCRGATLREEIAHRLVHAQSVEPDWEEALAECHTYNKMGGARRRCHCRNRPRTQSRACGIETSVLGRVGKRALWGPFFPPSLT